MPRRAVIPLAWAVGVLATAAIGLPATAQTVYRCDDGKGGTLYSDTPCKGGAKVDLLPGKADPAAIERVRREQRAFDERQAVRDARSAEEARTIREHRWAQREWQFERGAFLDRYAPGPDTYWGGLWPWYPTPPVLSSGPPRPPRPDIQAAPYVPALPGRLGTPIPAPARAAPPTPIAPLPRG